MSMMARHKHPRAWTQSKGTHSDFRQRGAARRQRGAFCLLGVLFLWPAALRAQNSRQDFDVFFAKFKLAVAQKDAGTLMTLMMPGFSFIRAQDVSPADVFQELNANEGLQGLTCNSLSRDSRCLTDSRIRTLLLVFYNARQRTPSLGNLHVHRLD
jgi:hypothetical protein